MTLKSKLFTDRPIMIEWLYVRFIMLYDNEFDNKIWIFCWKQWEACLELVGCILLCRCINYKSPICPQPTPPPQSCNTNNSIESINKYTFTRSRNTKNMEGNKISHYTRLDAAYRNFQMILNSQLVFSAEELLMDWNGLGSRAKRRSSR